jgi:hypothetical protein
MSSQISQLSSALWYVAIGPLPFMCRTSELEFGVEELGTHTPSCFYLFVLIEEAPFIVYQRAYGTPCNVVCRFLRDLFLDGGTLWRSV